EVMWRNIGNEDISVHLTSFSQPKLELVDAALSQDMNMLLTLISQGNHVRRMATTKTRQPLAEFAFDPSNWRNDSGVLEGEEQKRALIRFDQQLKEELNVKKVRLHDRTQGPLFSFTVSLTKQARSVLGKQFDQAAVELGSMDPDEVNRLQMSKKPLRLCGI